MALKATDEASAGRMWDAIDQEHFEAHKVAMREGLEEVGGTIAGSSAMPVLDGNLRDSVGHNGPISAANHNLGLGAPNFKKLVRSRKALITAKLPVGMEYASQQNKKTGFFDFGVSAAEGIFIRHVAEADTRVTQRLQ